MLGMTQNRWIRNPARFRLQKHRKIDSSSHPSVALGIFKFLTLRFAKLKCSPSRHSVFSCECFETESRPSSVSSELPHIRDCKLLQRRTAEARSLSFCISKTCPDAFSNQRPFEFGDTPENCENHLP